MRNLRSSFTIDTSHTMELFPYYRIFHFSLFTFPFSLFPYLTSAPHIIFSRSEAK